MAFTFPAPAVPFTLLKDFGNDMCPSEYCGGGGEEKGTKYLSVTLRNMLASYPTPLDYDTVGSNHQSLADFLDGMSSAVALPSLVFCKSCSFRKKRVLTALFL